MSLPYNTAHKSRAILDLDPTDACTAQPSLYEQTFRVSVKFLCRVADLAWERGRPRIFAVKMTAFR